MVEDARRLVRDSEKQLEVDGAREGEEILLNDEARMPNDEGMTKPECRKQLRLPFVIGSFGLRHFPPRSLQQSQAGSTRQNFRRKSSARPRSDW
jgi:hypothetical protein